MVLRDEDPLRDPNRGPLAAAKPAPPENLNVNRMLTWGWTLPLRDAVAADSRGLRPRPGTSASSRPISRDRLPLSATTTSATRGRDGPQEVSSTRHQPQDWLLALHPDDQLVAVRIDTLGGSSPPLLCDLGTTECETHRPGRLHPSRMAHHPGGDSPRTAPDPATAVARRSARRAGLAAAGPCRTPAAESHDDSPAAYRQDRQNIARQAALGSEQRG